MKKQEITRKEICSTTLSPEEVAQYLNVSLKTVHNWKNTGYLKFKKIGRRIFFRFEEIEALLKS